jgi:antirestriction protein ArdC
MSKDTVYEMVTERVIAMLEEGTVPWRKTWSAGSAPRNIEGRPYRGINVFLLAMAPYQSPFWLTYKQAQARGGTVRKGEKSTVVVFWKRLRIEEKDATGKTVAKTIPMLRYFRVFNLEQTEGVKLPKDVAEYDAEQAAVETRIEAEEIMSGYLGAENAPQFHERGHQPLYYPGRDVVEVPQRGTFESADEFYGAVFHELAHSTGHSSRLDRFKGNTAFGSHDYGREELIAEMTAAFLSAEAGIESTATNHAAYLQSWIKTIREDVRAVVVAAGAAQRAADMVLQRTPAQAQEEGQGQPAAATEEHSLAA